MSPERARAIELLIAIELPLGAWWVEAHALRTRLRQVIPDLLTDELLAVLYASDAVEHDGASPRSWRRRSSKVCATRPSAPVAVVEGAGGVVGEVDGEHVGEHVGTAPVDPQVCAIPSYRPGRYVYTIPALRAGLLTERTWGDMASRVSHAVSDVAVRDVCITLVADDEGRRPLLVVVMERVIDERPLFVAWTWTTSESVARTFGAAGWHRWSAEHPARWDDRGFLVDTADTTVPAPWLLTWRSTRILDTTRAAFGGFHDRLGVTDIGRLDVEVSLVSAAETVHRRQQVEAVTELRTYLHRRGWRGWTNPVRGHCAVCNMPLRDPASVRRGIGPDCWERVRGFGTAWHNRPDLRHSDVPARYWVGATPVAEFRERLSEMKMLHQPID